MNMKQKVLIVAGEGGHVEQAKRLIECFDMNKYEIFIATDSKNIFEFTDCKIITFSPISSFTKYYSFANLLYFNVKLIMMFPTLFKIFSMNKFSGLISLGPVFSIPCCLVAKLLRVKVIHIETWSRFSSKSFTGRVMYYLSDRFYFQNKGLSYFYPKGFYSGRL